MKLKLAATKQETKDVKSFIFEPQQPITWQAGQFLQYTLPHPDEDSRKHQRWFTNSAAPSEKHVMITTRLTSEKGSSFKKALNSLKVGDEVEAGAPEGDFTIDDPNRNYIFVAGGIGVTPYRSILTEAKANGQKLKVHLLYANRSNDIPFRQEFDDIAKQNPDFKVDYIIDPDKIDTPMLKAAIDAAKDPIIYVSGPEPMVEALNDDLHKLGLSDGQIKTDYFPNYIDEYRKS
jgi:glycine betaine catabolism B